MRSGFGKDLLIWTRIILVIVLISLFGLIFSQSNNDLFTRFLWIFIISCMIFIGILIRMTIHILKGNEVDEDLPSQKPY